MKINMPDDTARRLVKRLKDEQPGTDLANFRDRTMQTLEAISPKRKLTPKELQDLIGLATMARRALLQGNPDANARRQAEDWLEVIRKLQLMMQRTSDGA